MMLRRVRATAAMRIKRGMSFELVNQIRGARWKLYCEEPTPEHKIRYKGAERVSDRLFAHQLHGAPLWSERQTRNRFMKVTVKVNP